MPKRLTQLSQRRGHHRNGQHGAAYCCQQQCGEGPAGDHLLAEQHVDEDDHAYRRKATCDN
jgi:hypothetical protein